MKKFLLTLGLILTLSTLSYAGESEVVCPEGYKATIAPEGSHHFRPSCYMDTDTDTDTDTVGEPQDEAGVGADVVLWQNDGEESLVEEVTAEYRRDLENDTNAVYGVVRINLWNKIKDKLNKKDNQ